MASLNSCFDKSRPYSFNSSVVSQFETLICCSVTQTKRSAAFTRLFFCRIARNAEPTVKAEEPELILFTFVFIIIYHAICNHNYIATKSKERFVVLFFVWWFHRFELVLVRVSFKALPDQAPHAPPYHKFGGFNLGKACMMVSIDRIHHHGHDTNCVEISPVAVHEKHFLNCKRSKENPDEAYFYC